MAKALHCKDMGMECGFTAKGETEAQVMAQATQHAEQVHGMKMMDESKAKIKSAIHEESSRCAGCCG